LAVFPSINPKLPSQYTRAVEFKKSPPETLFQPHYSVKNRESKDKVRKWYWFNLKKRIIKKPHKR